MAKTDLPPLLEADVLVPTRRGRDALQTSGTTLPADQLEVLVLLDGRSTLGQTAARVRTRDREQVFALCARMFAEGLIEHAAFGAKSLDFVEFFKPKEPMAPTASQLARAEEDLAATTSLLQQKGFTVRIARRGDSAKDAAPGRKLCVLIVEDEKHLADVLKHILAGEGFEVRMAANKAEIVAGIAQQPLPDLILLDVMLPDVDGFDVLDRIRDHPATRPVPVVMLTAKATREAVLKGLLIGADGYITKPFEIDVLLKAVAAVLGLPEPTATKDIYGAERYQR